MTNGASLVLLIPPDTEVDKTTVCGAKNRSFVTFAKQSPTVLI